MKKMPIIVYDEDRFTNPDFEATYVVDIDDVIDGKLYISHLNVSQVYEWLPYNNGNTDVPEGDAERFEWLEGMNIAADTTDAEVMAAGRGYSVRYAKTAARFRKELIEKYGEERGSKVRYAEAFQLCEYGTIPDKETAKVLFGF